MGDTMFIFVFIGVISMLILTYIFFLKKNKSSNIRSEIQSNIPNTISTESTEFKPGYISDSPQRIGNQCNNTDKNILYPVNSIYVNYNTENSVPKTDCDIVKFNSLP
jgi:hypothetical protein